MAEKSANLIHRYLNEAIAAEEALAHQFQKYSKQAEDEAARNAFHQYAEEAKGHERRLRDALAAAGGSPPVMKILLGHIFGLGAKPADTDGGPADGMMQDLVLSCAVENSEAGMYQVLATMADAAGEGDTADLARDIQAQKHAAADKLRSLLPLIAGPTAA